MTIYDLNHKELLSVLHEYVEAFENLDKATSSKNYAYNKANHTNTKSSISLLVIILNVLSLLWIPTAFVCGFFVVGVLVYDVAENDTKLLLFEIIGALVTGIAYIFLRRIIMGFITKKFGVVVGRNIGTKKENAYLQECIDWEKTCQEKVSNFYYKYSMPDTLRSPIPTNWIYNFLLERNASLKTAIDAYHNYTLREIENKKQERMENYQKEQTEILRQMNERDRLRGYK